MIEIIHEPIDVQRVLASVRDDRCGATVLFLGTTRGVTGPRRTTSLEYDCYRDMATQVLTDLASQAARRWGILRCAIVHRIGAVDVGEASVAVAASAPHRRDAFAAGEWLIDTIKESVPIWKLEQWSDGQRQWQHPALAPRHPGDTTDE
jgi:molybdopterin synthase catalytic subunit